MSLSSSEMIRIEVFSHLRLIVHRICSPSASAVACAIVRLFMCVIFDDYKI